MIIQPPDSDAAFPPPRTTETSLFWPDSEGLLQNIISIDPALWEQPMTLMPSALASRTPPSPSFDSGVTSTAGDEGHRAIQSLSAQLNNTLTGITTPATLSDLTSKFLDSCLHMFFSNFIPMFPVVHQPTFVFRECSPPLLLNAIAIGSMFLGTKEASTKVQMLALHFEHNSLNVGRCIVASCTYCYCNILACNDQAQGSVRCRVGIATCPDLTAQSGLCCTLPCKINIVYIEQR
jgi:hypothetical protein